MGKVDWQNRGQNTMSVPSSIWQRGQARPNRAPAELATGKLQ